jgi:16S rRNA (cytosine1402-N4)-methyltransferase
VEELLSLKNYFKNGAFEIEEDLNPFSTEIKEKVFKLVSKKPIEASVEETKQNTRSRSAKLRVVEKM